MTPLWHNRTLLATLGIPLVLAVIGLSRLEDKLTDTRRQLLEATTEANDKRRERDVCLKMHDTCTATVTMQEAAAKKSAEELATCRLECTDYHELFNSFTAGIITTSTVTYLMDSKELRTYCDTDWKANIGKNYPGAKLVSTYTFEVSRTRAGAIFMVTCDWAVPSKLWCDKKSL